MFPGSTFLWECERPGPREHPLREEDNKLWKPGVGEAEGETHTVSLRLYTAANGRCLIKAFAISLACSVIPFCKQIR